MMKRLPSSSENVELNILFDMIDNQLIELETEMVNKVKEFEHLQ